MCIVISKLMSAISIFNYSILSDLCPAQTTVLFFKKGGNISLKCLMSAAGIISGFLQLILQQAWIVYYEVHPGEHG